MTSQYRSLVPNEKIIHDISNRELRTQQLLSGENSNHMKLNANDFLGLDVSSESENSEDEAISPRPKSSFAQTNHAYTSVADDMPPKPSVHSQMRRVSESIMKSAAKHSLSQQLSPKIQTKSVSVQELNDTQLKFLQNTLKDYCTQDLRNIVMTDLKEQLAQFTQSVNNQRAEDAFMHRSQMHHEPGESPSKEYLQYEAELAQNRLHEKKRLGSLLRFTSLGLSWFCNAMRFEAIDTRHLPAIVEKSISDGDYDDVLGNCGRYIHGTVLENPLFACGLKFIENIGQAHQRSMQEKLASYENQQSLNDDFVNISQLKAFRKGATAKDSKQGVFDSILNNGIRNDSKTKLNMTKTPKRTGKAVETKSHMLNELQANTKPTITQAEKPQPKEEDKETRVDDNILDDFVAQSDSVPDNDVPVHLPSAFGKIDTIVALP